MAEVGCLKDGHFQNLQVETSPILPDYQCQFDNQVTLSASTLTLAPATHSGRPVVQTVAAVFTLPGTVANTVYWVVNGAPDGTLMTVSPDGSDKILIDVEREL